MRKNILMLFLIYGILLPNLSAQNKLSFISVEGNNFLNDKGEVVVFRGVSVADPHDLEKEGVWGKGLFEEIKNWGANIVRFPVHPRGWHERGEDKYLKLLDEGIKFCEQMGIYVIIDWHSIGNLRTELFYNESYNTSKTETFRFWKTIASRYVNNSTVAFYEIFNEPTHYNGRFGKLSWRQHKELMEEIIGIIYAYDTTVIPLVAGLNWAYDLQDVRFEPISYPGVAYVTHPYPQKREKPWVEKWENDWGFIADHYPVMTTELGFMSADGPGAHSPVIADEEYGETIVNYFSQKGISWVVWVFHPTWSPQLIHSWNYEPTTQGKFFKQKMLELNK